VTDNSSRRKKPHYLPALPYLALNRAVELVDRALDPLGIFLVGSCLERVDYRDVDVRCMLKDEAYDRLFGAGHMVPAATRMPSGRSSARARPRTWSGRRGSPSIFRFSG
jgi:hypothetical protein